MSTAPTDQTAAVISEKGKGKAAEQHPDAMQEDTSDDEMGEGDEVCCLLQLGTTQPANRPRL